VNQYIAIMTLVSP